MSWDPIKFEWNPGVLVGEFCYLAEEEICELLPWGTVEACDSFACCLVVSGNLSGFSFMFPFPLFILIM